VGKIDTIIFDFDGVIIDSMSIKESGFRHIFSAYDEIAVEKLVQFHHQQGGLNRREKIRYFFDVILANSAISESVNVEHLLNSFSEYIMLKQRNMKYFNLDLISWIKARPKDLKLFIVSGADEEEVIELTRFSGIYDSFKEILGAPTAKDANIQKLLNKYNLNPDRTIMIGDSINDFTGSFVNNIWFMGYNNRDLKKSCRYYLDSINDIDHLLEKIY